MPEKFKGPEIESPEKILTPEEAGQLGGDMREYADGIRVRVGEIKAELARPSLDADRAKELQSELGELEEQLDGLDGFASDIEQGNYEEIVIR